MQRITTFLRLTLIFLLTTWVMAAAQPIHAAKWWVEDDYPDCIKASNPDYGDGSVCLGAHGSAVQGTVMSDLVRRILGPIPGVTIAYNETDQGYIKQMAQGSAINGISSYIAMMYQQPPANFGVWLADTGQTLGIFPKPAYAAAGVGFNGLAPLLGIWKVFRNIAYLLLAITMLVIGFMVMFRKKIDPKTVVTVQNSLPRIVVTLLLITFSYAIAGIMIDLMYLIIVLAISILPPVNNSAVGGAIFGTRTVQDYLSGGFPGLVGPLFTGGFSASGGIFSLLNNFWTVPPGPVFGHLLTWLILALILLFAIIRIFFMLVGAYIQVIIAVLTAPLQLLLEVLPGSESFASWIKNLIANLAAFPATIILIHIGTVLGQAGNINNLWLPPPLPGAAGTGVSGIAGLIALGLLLGIPSMVGAIKEALKAKETVPGAFGVVGGQVKSAFPLAMQVGGMWWQHQSMKSIFDQTGKAGIPLGGDHEKS